MIPIQTERLFIRNFRRDDWPQLQELVVGYQASEYAKYDHAWPTSSDALAEVTESFAGDDRYLAVCLVVGGTLIGLVTLMPPGSGPGEPRARVPPGLPRGMPSPPRRVGR